MHLAAANGTPRTALEAEAYDGFMSGSVALEREQWVVALKNFLRAQYE